MTISAKAAGAYTLNPEDMLQHAITMALAVACGLVSGGGTGALLTLSADAQLAERASSLIMRHMLREMVGGGPLDEGGFRRLVIELVAMTKES